MEASRAHICHKYHKLYLWRRNCHVEKFWEIFGKIWEIFRNFGKYWESLGDVGRFCHTLRAFMWRKIEPKKYICGEKMTNMRSGSIHFWVLSMFLNFKTSSPMMMLVLISNPWSKSWSKYEKFWSRCYTREKLLKIAQTLPIGTSEISGFCEQLIKSL